MLLKRKIKNRNYSKEKKLFFLGLFFLLIGFFLFFSCLFISYQQDCGNRKSIDYFFKVNNVDSNQIVDSVNEKMPKDIVDYIAILEIPKINLNRGLVAINDKDNIVDKNIQILKESDMPNIVNGIFMLASHSGWGETAYFNKIDKLVKGDEIYVYYGSMIYTYQVNNSYMVKKVGKVHIHRDPTKTQLALITCSNKNNEEQLVVMANLINKDNYS